MKSKNQINWKWLFYRITLGFFSFVLFPYRILMYSRNEKSSLSKEAECQMFYFFDKIEERLKSGVRIEYIRQHCYTYIVIDDDYVLTIWDTNRPYADMRLSVFDVQSTHDLSRRVNISFEKDAVPSFALAWKMRGVCDLLKSKYEPTYNSPHDDVRLIHTQIELTPEIIKEIESAFLMEML